MRMTSSLIVYEERHNNIYTLASTRFVGKPERGQCIFDLFLIFVRGSVQTLEVDRHQRGFPSGQIEHCTLELQTGLQGWYTEMDKECEGYAQVL